MSTPAVRWWQRLSESELLAGTRACLKNAQDHLAVAGLMEDHGRIGFACMHAVLSIEEAVKSNLYGAIRAGAMVGRPVWWSDTQLAKALSVDHVTRHLMAEFFLWVDDFFEDKGPFAPVTSEVGHSSVDFVEKANHLKQAGTYVDHARDGWTVPDDVSIADWIELKKVAERFVARTEKNLNPGATAHNGGQNAPAAPPP